MADFLYGINPVREALSSGEGRKPTPALSGQGGE